ncbi:MAG: DUF3313 family protein [Gammaproteobacteria bacterium]|nr:DUF3313 family protein [Gammaproteobacteria bacterium]
MSLAKNFILTAAILGFVIGCATAQPKIDESANAEETFDGLLPVKNSRFQRAWIDPTIDLSGYTKIMPGGASFEFRAARKMSASQARRSSASNFYISEKDQEKLKQVVDEIFNEELQKSQYFTMTDRPGPDVLIIEGALLDIVSNVPPDIVGRGEIYLDRVGEATLVLQLIDSMSGEVLARAAERRAAQPAGRMGIQSSPVTTWNEVRRLARRWAVKLRDGLDDFKAQTG